AQAAPELILPSRCKPIAARTQPQSANRSNEPKSVAKTGESFALTKILRFAFTKPFELLLTSMSSADFKNKTTMFAKRETIPGGRLEYIQAESPCVNRALPPIAFAPSQ